MARVPVVESPCPIAGKPLPAGGSEHCTLCERPVHNLDRMNERERIAFMSSCSGRVCVAYTVRLPVSGLRKRGVVAATVAVAAMVSLPLAAAEDSPVQGMSPVTPAAQLPNCDELLDAIVVGGVSHGDQAEWADDGKDDRPELPVIEDDGR